MGVIRKRHGLVTIWLRLAIIIYLFAVVWNIFAFSTSDNKTIALVSGIDIVLNMWALLAIILLMRWNKLGFYLLMLTSFLSAGVSIVYDNDADVIYAVAFPVVWLIAWWGILQIKSNKVSCWNNLFLGWDYKHCRHLYQLWGGLMAVLTICIGGIYCTKENEIPTVEDIDCKDINYCVNKTSVTLSELKYLSQIDTLTHRQKERIFALQHILVNHIVTDKHDYESFMRTYYLRRDALSQKQQEVLDWFFRQQDDVRVIWERSPGVGNLEIFREELVKEMRRLDIMEF